MSTQVFFKDKHIEYIKQLNEHKNDLEYWLTEHLRINGLFWGVTALDLMNSLDSLPKNEVVDFVLSCLNSDGGFGAAPGHDSHLLYTLSAIQLLVIYDSLHKIDREKVANYICERQNKHTGACTGDIYGEEDTRFAYLSVSSLSLLGVLNKRAKIAKEKFEKAKNNGNENSLPITDETSFNTQKTVEYILSCMNFDGGFGNVPGAESHSGQVFVCLGALSILGELNKNNKKINYDKLSAWLSERQVPNGGLNGRPEKLPDVCYSWWVLSSLSMLGRISWIDGSKLREFILSAQDEENGGIADRKDDEADVFHTTFGIAGLSLLGYENLQPIDPVYYMPCRVMDKIEKFVAE